MNLLQLAAVGACFAALAIQAVAGACCFRAPQGMAARTLAVIACFVLAGSANLAVMAKSKPGTAFSIAAILLYTASQALFFAALRANRSQKLSVVFSADEPRHLIRSGPYRHIRHPFYTAYSATWVAGAVGSASLPLAGVAAGMFLLYWAAARFEECKFQRSLLASAYATYRGQTGMFLPRFLCSSKAVRGNNAVC
jgi:protein-S-isoprenylcysteine O-methyltransferase Ste14